MGTVVQLSMSADATCRGLRSPTDGPLVMEFTKGWHPQANRQSLWLSGYWLAAKIMIHLYYSVNIPYIHVESNAIFRYIWVAPTFLPVSSLVYSTHLARFGYGESLYAQSHERSHSCLTKETSSHGTKSVTRVPMSPFCRRLNI